MEVNSLYARGSKSGQYQTSPTNVLTVMLA